MAGRLIGRMLAVSMLTASLALIGSSQDLDERRSMPLDYISPPIQSLAVQLDTLKPDPNNARRHTPRNLEEIQRSLAAHGQQKPIVIDADGVVLAGNGMYRAAEKLGWESIAAVRSTLSGSAAQAYAIADNRTSDLAEWDDEVLSRTLQALRSDNLIDATSTGFSDIEIDLMLSALEESGPESDPDEAPPLPEDGVTVSSAGDLWTLGPHRLLVGDCTDATLLQKLLEGEKVDLVVTDPPYNMNYKSKPLGGIENDHLDRGSFARLILASMRQIQVALKVGGSYYVCMGTAEYAGLAHQLTRLGMKHQLLVWVKPSPGMGAQEFRPQYELILYGYMGTRSQRTWNGARRMGNVWEFDLDMPVFAREEDEGMVVEVDRGHDSVEIHLEQRCDGEVLLEDGSVNDIWKFGRERGGYAHPTQKPVDLIRRAVTLSSNEGDSVLDLFSGSGTTLIAADRAGRIFRGMELDPRYADVICQRWVQAGHEPPRRHDGALFTDIEPADRGAMA